MMNEKLASYSVATAEQSGTQEGSSGTAQSVIPFPQTVSVKGLAGTPRVIGAAAISKSSGASCRNYRFPVKLAPDSEQIIELAGELATCRPLAEDLTVQVLLAGGSNNASYWDWPLDPENHSYVRHATREGFVTLNLDRPGYGKSDHPDPASMDFAAQAYLVHQVLEYLKQGALGYKFKRVVLNGHSMGGMVAWHTASRYATPDAVIVSGVAHNLAINAMDAVLAALEPIETHPRYGAGTGWAPGYFVRRLTSAVPTSAADWYTSMLQDTVMAAELNAMVNDSRDYSITSKISVPVLFALGRYDLRWCTTTGDCATDPAYLEESKYYHPEADFTAFLIPDTGHLNNKDPGAHHFFDRATEWLRERGF